MNKAIKNTVNRFLSLRNLTIEKSTDKKLVLSLIENLHPFSTEKDLIRLGPNGDGGYLIPNDIEGIEACFSPGVADNYGFEIDCLNLGMETFLADKSADSPMIIENQFHFIKKFVGSISNEDFITMDDWVNSNIKDLKSELLLQMDIEGTSI